MNSFDIKLLVDYPQAIPKLVSGFQREWNSYYGIQGLGDAKYDLSSCLNRTTLPIGIVALTNNLVCGTAALKAESVNRYPNCTPWLAALYVDPAFRRLGIGTRLMEEVEKLAKQLGYNKLFVGIGSKSGISPNMLSKSSWIFSRKDNYNNEIIRLYEKRLL